MSKCLICNEKAIVDDSVVGKDVARPLCEKHSWGLKGYLVQETYHYTTKIKALQNFIDRFIEEMKPKKEKENG